MGDSQVAEGILALVVNVLGPDDFPDQGIAGVLRVIPGGRDEL